MLAKCDFSYAELQAQRNDQSKQGGIDNLTFHQQCPPFTSDPTLRDIV